ncbi:hypothetical protein [Paracoccus mutanolyticus]|uniref:hypothetical protein n=1 Tax=Paracoccus mutanolyticus TaxID=1499308 RepID=UPI0037C7681E
MARAFPRLHSVSQFVHHVVVKRRVSRIAHHHLHALSASQHELFALRSLILGVANILNLTSFVSPHLNGAFQGAIIVIAVFLQRRGTSR